MAHEERGQRPATHAVVADPDDPRVVRVEGDLTVVAQELASAAAAVLQRSSGGVVIDASAATGSIDVLVAVVNVTAARASHLGRAVVVRMSPGLGAGAARPPFNARVIVEGTSRPAPAVGAPRKEGSGFIVSYGTGRTCSVSDCHTSLSRYNDSPVCGAHALDTRRTGT